MSTVSQGAQRIPGAGGVIFGAAGRVLLLRHRKGEWVFPKGHIDPGESALEAALREVEEEAGVRAYPLAPDVIATTRYRNDRRELRQISWFLLATDDSEPLLREALFPEGGFFAPDEALRRLSFAEDRRLLERMRARYQLSMRGRAPQPRAEGV